MKSEGVTMFTDGEKKRKRHHRHRHHHHHHKKDGVTVVAKASKKSKATANVSSGTEAKRNGSIVEESDILMSEEQRRLFEEFNGSAPIAKRIIAPSDGEEEEEEAQLFTAIEDVEGSSAAVYTTDVVNNNNNARRGGSGEGEWRTPPEVEGNTLQLLEIVDPETDIWIFNRRALPVELTPKMRELLQGDRVQPLSDILGLYKAKKLLERGVLFNVVNKEIYSVFRRPYMLCIYGREGSGKRSLVLSFSKHHSINVIEVNRRYHCPGWIKSIIQTACMIKPCIILFHHCDFHFSRGNNTGWAQECLYFMQSLLKESAIDDVWIVLATIQQPMALHEDINAETHRHSQYAEPPRNAGDDPDDIDEKLEDRTLMFHRVFAQGWGKGRWTYGIYDDFLNEVIKNYSDSVIFKDVWNLARSLYEERLEELDYAACSSLNKHDARTMPSQEALQRRLQNMKMTCMQRFTNVDVRKIHEMYKQQKGEY